VKDFKDKVAVVTGAASGIGLGMARAFASEGMSVALCDIRADKLDEAARQIRDLGARTIELAVDVSDRAAVERAAAAVEAEFGRVHVVANNAGVALKSPLEAVTDAEWDWVIGVNLYGVIHGVQAFLPRIRKHGEGGHIVNTASIGGFQVREGRQTGAYSTTKFAVVAFSDALRNDLRGSGIGVSVLAPSAVNTAIYQAAANKPARFGQPPATLPATPDDIRNGMDPDDVGRRVVAGIRNDEFYLFTHPDSRGWVEERHRGIMEGFDAAERWRTELGR
jgi:NAD(P)-dependent dehydrogenase (short-subunit alcohol dehydrogenase family)